MKWDQFHSQNGADRFEPGDWNVIDDRTGRKVKASTTQRQWDGARTQRAEPRHPQDFLRALPERIRTPWSRPEQDDEFVN